ncbi:MAG: hypothetical protein KDK70_02085 [Myxococcales bacterium]|nr:hypothetical protein [Myxococcales bacterium]
MCIFTGDATVLDSVRGTAIFAGARADGRQVLAYRMTVAAREPVAMVLPLPVPPAGPEDAVRFIDLSGYGELFDDLHRAFPQPVSGTVSLGFAPQAASRAPTLVVHSVGAFVASFVPTRADFSRLDPRFGLSDAVWDALPQYADWGFAVFQLHDAPRRRWVDRLLGRWPVPPPRTIHPMAFEFPRRDPRELFFPTVHVHDGAVHPEAHFDHTLYAQLQPGRVPAGPDWEPSGQPLSDAVDVARSAGVVAPGEPGYRRRILGPHPNRDTLVGSVEHGPGSGR